MSIDLYIESLLLEGLPLQRGQEHQVRRAMERELTTLLAGGALHGALRSGGAIDHLQATALQATGTIRPTDLGKQVARSVFGGLAK